MNYFTQDNTEGFTDSDLDMMNQAIVILLDGSTDEDDIKNMASRVNNNFDTDGENTVLSLVGLNLSYEYNEYVAGYVVTDKTTGRSVNFQFEKINSNHPTPDFKMSFGCEGDDTCNAFTETELVNIENWLRSHDDVDALEDAYTAAFYAETLPEFTGALYAWEILEAAEKANP